MFQVTRCPCHPQPQLKPSRCVSPSRGEEGLKVRPRRAKRQAAASTPKLPGCMPKRSTPNAELTAKRLKARLPEKGAAAPRGKSKAGESLPGAGRPQPEEPRASGVKRVPAKGEFLLKAETPKAGESLPGAGRPQPEEPHPQESRGYQPRVSFSPRQRAQPRIQRSGARPLGRVSLSPPQGHRQDQRPLQLPRKTRQVATKEASQESLSLTRAKQRVQGTVSRKRLHPKQSRWMTLKTNIRQNLPKKCLHFKEPR